MKKIIKKILRKIYHIVFSKRIQIKKLTKENEQLKYQLEYMKFHFDIEKMKPATGWLRDYQLKEVKYAREVIDIFEKIGVNPFLDYGCLVGHVRHNGFVPWDDDIDFGVIRSEYELIKQYCNEHFVVINTNNCKNILELTDLSIKNHPNEYVVIETPNCLHVYKGESLKDSLNVEFFVYDFVKESVTKEEFLNYQEYVKNNIRYNKPWKDSFNFYECERKNSSVFTAEKSSKIYAGLGNMCLFQSKFYGFIDYKILYPLIEIDFEGEKFLAPHDVKKFLIKQYNGLGYPTDVGISHDLVVINEYLRTINSSIEYKEF